MSKVEIKNFMKKFMGDVSDSADGEKSKEGNVWDLN